MVMDNSDSERENPLPPHGLLFTISSRGYFILYASSLRQDDTYHGLCYTSYGSLAGKRNTLCIEDITFVFMTDDVYDTSA